MTEKAKARKKTDRPLWELSYQDPSWSEPKTYTFDPQKLLTVQDLVKIQDWYGPEIGRYLTFTSAFSQGDPTAALCALWLVRRAAGEPEVPEPHAMPNFSMGDFYSKFIPAETEIEEEDPTQPSEPAQTKGSTETPKNSEASTSVSSPTPAT
jgi:hypothetical protein